MPKTQYEKTFLEKFRLYQKTGIVNEAGFLKREKAEFERRRIVMVEEYVELFMADKTENEKKEEVKRLIKRDEDRIKGINPDMFYEYDVY